MSAEGKEFRENKRQTSTPKRVQMRKGIGTGQFMPYLIGIKSRECINT